VALQGPSPLWRELRRPEDRDTLARELRELLGALDVVVTTDAVHPVIPVDEHRRRADVLGEALRLLQAVVRGEERLDGLDAGALAGVASDDPEAVHAYVRRILEGVDGELAARMLGSGGGAP
jgi:hypothetical protein